MMTIKYKKRRFFFLQLLCSNIYICYQDEQIKQRCLTGRVDSTLALEVDDLILYMHLHPSYQPLGMELLLLSLVPTEEHHRTTVKEIDMLDINISGISDDNIKQ